MPGSDGRLATSPIAADPDSGTSNAQHGNAPQLFTHPGRRVVRFPVPLSRHHSGLLRISVLRTTVGERPSRHKKLDEIRSRPPPEMVLAEDRKDGAGDSFTAGGEQLR